MGVVMMTGIMAVVEMGLSLTGQSLLLKPVDSYQQNRELNAVGKRDQQMLGLLHDQADLDAIGRSLQSTALCVQLLCRSSLLGAASCAAGNSVVEDAETRLPDLTGLTQAGVIPSAGNWANACVLQSGSHRLIIHPDPSPDNLQIPYRLFSCVLSGASTCSFEPKS